MTKRAVLYARVAAGNERLGQRLLAEQLTTCRQYAEEHGLEVVAELAEDKGGVGGVRCDRPQLKRALEMAQASEFDVLVVRDMARLSRKLGQLVGIAQELQRRGVQLESVFSDKRERALPARKEKRRTAVIEEVIVYTRVSGEGETWHHLIRQAEILQSCAVRRSLRRASKVAEE